MTVAGTNSPLLRLTAVWVGLLVLLIVIQPTLHGAGASPRDVVAASGGGILPITPPTFAPPPVLGGLVVPTLLEVQSASGQAGPWFVQVRTQAGILVAAGVTGASGAVILGLPKGAGLFLDVLVTDAVDIPVVAGQSVFVIID